MDRMTKFPFDDFSDPAAKSAVDPFLDKTIRRQKSESFRIKMSAQWPQPGIELLGGKFILELGQALLPDGRVFHVYQL